MYILIVIDTFYVKIWGMNSHRIIGKHVEEFAWHALTIMTLISIHRMVISYDWLSFKENIPPFMQVILSF